MNKGFAIAIDGPVASGKGTLAPKLAEKLNAFYLDTGAMYRCVALFALNNNIDPKSEEKISEMVDRIDIDFNEGKTFLNGKDVSFEIRRKVIHEIVPIVAGYKKVRERLIEFQKQIAKKVLDNNQIFIAEGRDIGTIVLPNADFKLYLTADEKTRARRRQAQLEERGEYIDFEAVLNDLKVRDNRDIEINKTLVKKPEEFGYTVLDNSNWSEDETISRIVDELKLKGLYD